MKICYLIQTYKNPQQIYRLIDTIKTASPDSVIIAIHDFTHCHLDLAQLKNSLGVQIFESRGGRADFSLMQGYLDAVDWLLRNQIEFDWLINLTGQDYPIQPIEQIESFLAQTSYDGFIGYQEVLTESGAWGLREGKTRYCYRYRQLIADLSDRYKDLLKPLKIINYLQPFVRVNCSYGLVFGVKTATPFKENFICYGGSYFCTLSKKCVQYLHQFAIENPDLVNYYRNVEISSESFLQTILVNSRLFYLCNDSKRYYDFSGTRHGRPRILTVKDYPAIVQSDCHFARKFDLNQDSQILDLLQERILQVFSLCDGLLESKDI